jgi:hypothetical protein
MAAEEFNSQPSDKPGTLCRHDDVTFLALRRLPGKRENRKRMQQEANKPERIDMQREKMGRYGTSTQPKSQYNREKEGNTNMQLPQTKKKQKTE